MPRGIHGVTWDGGKLWCMWAGHEFRVPLSYRKPCVIVVMRSEGSVGGGKADW